MKRIASKLLTLLLVLCALVLPAAAAGNANAGAEAPLLTARYYNRLYSSSDTGSSHSLLVFSPGTSTAR